MARTLPQRTFVRSAVRRFMPGEDRESALGEAERLQARQIRSVFTLLGENVTNAAEVGGVVGEYMELLEEIRNRGTEAEISVKLTQLGLDVDRALAVDALRTLVGKAGEVGSFVWLDMEASPYLSVTKEIFLEVRGKGEPLGLCLQAYLRSTGEDLKALLSGKPPIRLVKGAYAEPPSVAFPRKKDVDSVYFDLTTTALAEGARVGVATHDGRLVERIRAWLRENQISKDRYEFQMLFGVRASEQDRLAREQEPVRVLISYGPSWFPWYMRRLAERPANLWFVLRNLFVR
jgi:proline dehydrogenase